MDKLHLDPNTKLLTEEYAEGVRKFMRLVQQQPEANTDMLRCLCSSCNNNQILKEWDVWTHLYMRGFTQNYKVWYLYGENGYEYGLRMVVVDHYIVLHSEIGFFRGVIPRRRARRMSKTQSRLFFLQSLLHLFHRLIPLLHMIMVPCRLSFLFSNPVESISVCSKRIHKDTQLVHKSKNGISRCINQMMYSMLCKGYSTYSVMPSEECHLSHHFNWESGLTETAVPKKKGRLVGLARRLSSCPSSSQAPFAPPDPMIIEQLQNKYDRIVAPETPNATILTELAGQKKTKEIMKKMKRLFPAEFS
ncbi:hypothetical protein IGI04_003567 [Brassica rapa subsp. trilocularis]|uniref:Transposase-associated domain-containing protein n=1 Tax=Brassica rapa subsp. trilocularis TaxID=1813537 RepID=A0ABQ7NYU9_BRACM|nr:hypothetical protein IGI04_003567 [Brassica rapa subsp. trilocularis]